MISRARACASAQGRANDGQGSRYTRISPSLNFCWIPNVKSERRLFCSDCARTTQVDSLSKKAGKVV
jgi:hypothetical protein